ncbi:MAG: hypothetical protein KGK02_01165 [Rhodospirillales bacterium]|nr:hypothetical protein [Rhodospirillales bacterium]
MAESTTHLAHTIKVKNSCEDLTFARFILLSGLSFVVTWAAIWAYIVTFPMLYQDRDYPLALAKQELLAQCQLNRVVVFGDSKAVAGILPTAMSIPVENLAFPAATPIETYFLVKRLLRCPEAPRLVIIAHSTIMYSRDKFFWSIAANSGILNRRDMQDVVAEARNLNDIELENAERPSSVPYAFLPELYAARFPPLYFANLLGGYVAARWRYNERAYQEAISSYGRSSFGTAASSNGVSDEAQMDNWRPSPLINFYLNRTLGLLASHHVPVVMMTLPINAATCSHLPPTVQARFSVYLKKIAQNNANIVLTDSAIPCWPDRFFGDDMHFNMSGAVTYSHKLQSVIAEILNKRENLTAFNPDNQQLMVAWTNSRLREPAGEEAPDD